VTSSLLTRIFLLLLLVATCCDTICAQTPSINDLRLLFDYDQNASLDIKEVGVMFTSLCLPRKDALPAPAPWRRNAPGSEPEAVRNNFIQSVVDLRRGIDLLRSRSDVDPDRIAYVGHSSGVHWGADWLRRHIRIGPIGPIVRRSLVN